MVKPKAVWLDCDPGHDDAIAIVVAGYHPGLRLLGISSVGGNQSISKVTLNALHVLEASGLSHIDVVEGQANPLLIATRPCPEIHGDTGLDKREGGHVFGSTPPKKQALEGKGVIIMAKAIMTEFGATGDKVTLICTGPLTNGALLFMLYPEIKNMVEVVIMGGCMGVGNTGPVVEYNIQTDPEGAKCVFSSGVPLTMVPLEVTHTALAKASILSRIEAQSPSPFRKAMIEILMYFADTYKEIFRFDDPPIHDPCAVVFASNPDIFEVKHMRVDIETISALSPGQTVCDIWGHSDQPKNCNVAMKMDVAKFWDIVVQAIDSADERSPMNAS